MRRELITQLTLESQIGYDFYVTSYPIILIQCGLTSNHVTVFTLLPKSILVQLSLIEDEKWYLGESGASGRFDILCG